jgi:hypothetical protein
MRLLTPGRLGAAALVALVLLITVGPVVAPALTVPASAGPSAWLLPVAAVVLLLAVPVGVVLLVSSLLSRRAS